MSNEEPFIKNGPAKVIPPDIEKVRFRVTLASLSAIDVKLASVAGIVVTDEAVCATTVEP
jgi:hypothetical protein